MNCSQNSAWLFVFPVKLKHSACCIILWVTQLPARLFQSLVSVSMCLSCNSLPYGNSSCELSLAKMLIQRLLFFTEHGQKCSHKSNMRYQSVIVVDCLHTVTGIFHLRSMQNEPTEGSITRDKNDHILSSRGQFCSWPHPLGERGGRTDPLAPRVHQAGVMQLWCQARLDEGKVHEVVEVF